MSISGLRTYADAEAVAAAASILVIDEAHSVLRERPVFHLGLAGGRTPEALYRLLAKAAGVDDRWHLYLGDERVLPAGDATRNDTMVRRAWLEASSTPLPTLHAPDPAYEVEVAAGKYERVLREAHALDLVLLGMGEDGHTASLFPGHVWDAGAWVMIERNSPKPPPLRISLGPAALAAARRRLFLITGEDKAEALHAWTSGEDLPVARVAASGPSVVIVDEAAARLL